MWPSRWFTATRGRSWRKASVLAMVSPTRSEPASPGPKVTAMASTSPASCSPARAIASSRTGSIQRRWARAATSGTIPPVRAWSTVWLATTLARIRRPASTMATAVSSQLDSTASRRRPAVASMAIVIGRPGRPGRLTGRLDLGAETLKARAHGGRPELLGGHDQRVLGVVRVVARAHADGHEAETLVETARFAVRETHLQGGHRGAQLDGQVEQGQQEPGTDALPPPGRQDGEGRDVRLVHHQPDAAVADRLAPGARHEVAGQPVRLELLAEGVGRPRHGEAGALDLVHVGDVFDAHGGDAHPQRRSGDHAAPPPAAATPRGRVTYVGTSWSAGSRRPVARARAPRRGRAAPSPASAAPPSATSGATASASGRATGTRRAPVAIASATACPTSAGASRRGGSMARAVPSRATRTSARERSEGPAGRSTRASP